MAGNTRRCSGSGRAPRRGGSTCWSASPRCCSPPASASPSIERRRRWWRGDDVGCSALRVLVLAGVAIGLWQVGQGGWIYAKALLAQHMLQHAWARTLAGEREVRPWPWADTWPVARLRVPVHGIDLIVLDGVSGRTLAFGPGHAGGSAPPGAPGTAIISGHRDTHFRFLQG